MDRKIIIFIVTLILAVDAQYTLTIPCKKDETCQQIISREKMSRCLSDQCMCFNITNQVFESCFVDSIVAARQKEFPSLIGRTCKDDNECSLKHGFCNRMKAQCDCDSNFVAARNNTQCLKIAKSFQDSCTDDIQCLATILNSTCENSKCRCVDGYHQISNSNYCEKNVEFKGACTLNRECDHIEGAKCYEQSDGKRICNCPLTMVLNVEGLRCLSIAKAPNHECIETPQCTGALGPADCIDKKCQCRTGYHFVQSRQTCVKNKVYGESCKKEEESCHQLSNNLNALVCTNKNVCECINDKYVYTDNLCQYSDASRAITNISLIILFVIILAGQML